VVLPKPSARVRLDKKSYCDKAGEKRHIFNQKISNMKKYLILLIAVCSIWELPAQTLSHDRVEKYKSKPHTQKVLKNRQGKKVAKSIKAHPLTSENETASTGSIVYEPKVSAPSPTVVATIPASGTIIYSVPNIGLSAITIEPYNTGWTTQGSVVPSFSYSIGIGEYSTNLDGSLDVQPYINLGAFAAVGYIPSANSASLQVGGELGIYKYTNLAIGYDLVTHKPFVGVGAAISLSTFKKGLGSTIIDTF
jgi:hypothetical protein